MRQWLIDLREKQGIDRRKMAEKCECTYTMLLIMEEDDALTHPRIAARIADEYGIRDVNLFNSLIPRDRKVTKIPKREPKPDKEINWEDLFANGIH